MHIFFRLLFLSVSLDGTLGLSQIAVLFSNAFAVSCLLHYYEGVEEMLRVDLIPLNFGAKKSAQTLHQFIISVEVF